MGHGESLILDHTDMSKSLRRKLNTGRRNRKTNGQNVKRHFRAKMNNQNFNSLAPMLLLFRQR